MKRHASTLFATTGLILFVGSLLTGSFFMLGRTPAPSPAPTPTPTVTAGVTVGAWGQMADFERFSVLLQEPRDNSASYGCPDGPCPIIAAPLMIQAKDKPVPVELFTIEAFDLVGSKLTVAALGLENLPAGMTHTTDLQIWTSSQHLKDRLTIRLTSIGRTVEWRQDSR